MKLLTKEILNKLPALGATENIPEADKVIRVKFFNPTGAGTWFAVEFDPKEGLFFGYVEGLGGDEWGYFSLQELESYRGHFGLGIERDLHYPPRKFSERKG
jgi:hypothetical protein